MIIGLFDFEPALARLLDTLLSQEPDCTISHDLRDDLDVVLLATPSLERIAELKDRLPRARLISMGEWHRHPPGVDHNFDRFEGYPALVRLLRGDLG